MKDKQLFSPKGVHVLVDGQYGSTGKGALAAWLSNRPNQPQWAGVISNAGPNSGHTFYNGPNKHVLKQLPTFAVAHYLRGRSIPVILSAGAVINPEILAAEAKRYLALQIFVHPNAAVITREDIEAEKGGTIAAVAGTKSGTGMAIARKILRDPTAVVSAHWQDWSMPDNVHMAAPLESSYNPDAPYFMEISQGFSLGINQRFYPKCTSRECSVAQGMSDAALPPRHVSMTYMSTRTFPIRVANVDGHSSGDCYEDQNEITWDDLRQQPELTTVTQRVRRVFTYSPEQIKDAIRVNDPDWIFHNFMNYTDLTAKGWLNLWDSEVHDTDQFGHIFGYGPKSEDIRQWQNG